MQASINCAGCQLDRPKAQATSTTSGVRRYEVRRGGALQPPAAPATAGAAGHAVPM
jgi:hypothetical protein